LSKLIEKWGHHDPCALRMITLWYSKNWENTEYASKGKKGVANLDTF